MLRRLTILFLFIVLIYSCSGKYSDFENAHQAVLNIGIGWNLGNTLESCSYLQDSIIEKTTDCSVQAYETAWGQPQATRELIHKFKEAGFKGIRVPVTWWPHMDADYKVDDVWMDRVEEVVDYVLDEDMYCILNVHHDVGGAPSCWLRADAEKFDSLNVKFTVLWKQIAERFNRYGEKLIFEGYGEMLDKNLTWIYPSDTTAIDVCNRFAESFVKTVRSTGRNNSHRNLMICTYGAHTGGIRNYQGDSADGILTGFQMPQDEGDHLIASVHIYLPWNWDQNHGRLTSEGVMQVKDVFFRLDKYLQKRGWPVVIGEYGCVYHDEVYPSPEPVTEADKDEAAKYASLIISEAKKYDMATFYFMGLIDKADRTKLVWTRPKTVEAILDSYYNTEKPSHL